MKREKNQNKQTNNHLIEFQWYYIHKWCAYYTELSSSFIHCFLLFFFGFWYVNYCTVCLFILSNFMIPFDIEFSTHQSEHMNFYIEGHWCLTQNERFFFCLSKGIVCFQNQCITRWIDRSRSIVVLSSSPSS